MFSRRSILLLVLAGVVAAGGALAQAPPPASAPQKSETIRRWETRLSMGDPYGAEEVIRAALAVAPDDIQLHVALAMTLAEAEPPRLDEAEVEARRAYKIDPSTPDALVRLAVILRDAGRLDGAEAVLQEALGRFPDHANLLHILGTVRSARGEDRPALRLLKQASELAQADMQIRRDFGLELVAIGYNGRALQTLLPVRHHMPDDLETREALGRIYRELDDEKHAAEEEAVARRLAADAAREETLATAIRSLSQRIHALEETAASASPPAGTFADLLQLYNQRGDMAWNLPRLAQLAVGRPDSLEARATLGLLRLRGGEPEAAAKIFSEVLEASPAEPLALRGVFLLYREGRDQERLMAIARRAVEAKPEKSAAHLYLGIALLEQKDPEGATREMRQAVELDPTNLEALLRLATHLQAQKKLEEAEELLRRAIKADPQAARPHMELGVVLLKRGERADAAEHLTRALELGNRHFLLFRSLGDLAGADGDREAAVAYYELSLSANPNQPGLRAQIQAVR